MHDEHIFLNKNEICIVITYNYLSIVFNHIMNTHFHIFNGKINVLKQLKTFAIYH